jgi:hypothetical protein
LPRRKLPPRLYLDQGRKQWIIRDGDRRIRTGLAELERVAAERQLTDYLVKTVEVRKRPSFVYFIECGDYIKIGYATSIRARLCSLTTSTPYPLNVLATIDGDKHTEAILHARFADAFHRGEWFRKTPELLALIDQINSSEKAAS